MDLAPMLMSEATLLTVTEVYATGNDNPHHAMPFALLYAGRRRH